MAELTARVQRRRSRHHWTLPPRLPLFGWISGTSGDCHHEEYHNARHRRSGSWGSSWRRNPWCIGARHRKPERPPQRWRRTRAKSGFSGSGIGSPRPRSPSSSSSHPCTSSSSSYVQLPTTMKLPVVQSRTSPFLTGKQTTLINILWCRRLMRRKSNLIERQRERERVPLWVCDLSVFLGWIFVWKW